MARPIRRCSISARFALLVLAAALPDAVLAQAYQCRMPAELPLLRPESGPAQRMPITGYTLALSWSPEFCRGKERDSAHRLQCSGAAGRFGFVVHGLWPEGARGAPQYCRRVAPPAPPTLRAQLCRTPSLDLLGHEWAKHGSCISRGAEGYFRASNILAGSIRYPAMERLSYDRALTAGGIRAAFAAENRGRPANSFGLLLSRSGWLREVFVCLDRRFRPLRCPARQYGPRDAATVKIWRGL